MNDQREDSSHLDVENDKESPEFQSMIDRQEDLSLPVGLSRRHFLGASSAALATAAAAGLTAHAQTRENTRKGERDQSASDPGQENQPLKAENPSSFSPPPTDHGDVGPIWYSMNIVHRRIQEGGWTRQVTERQLPSSQDIAGVNMRLTAGSFRELHWHTADEWAFMLDGNARVTILDLDGNISIEDVGKGDLWFFPEGLPHSIQGLGPDGCEFLLVFNQGMFSEDNTFLLSEWLAHTPPEVLTKNLGLDRNVLAKLPKDQLYIFPADLPLSLAQDRAAAGGARVASSTKYTFKLEAMAPTYKTAGGEARIVDSGNFPVSKGIAGALNILKPGAMRELHWHPNASEWQFWIAGKARMTVFMPGGNARTMDFNANDVGYVPKVAPHYFENTGDTDAISLELFASDRFMDVSLNNWLRRLPPEMVTSHLNLTPADINRIPAGKEVILPGKGA